MGGEKRTKGLYGLIYQLASLPVFAVFLISATNLFSYKFHARYYKREDKCIRICSPISYNFHARLLERSYILSEIKVLSLSCIPLIAEKQSHVQCLWKYKNPEVKPFITCIAQVRILITIHIPSSEQLLGQLIWKI